VLGACHTHCWDRRTKSPYYMIDMFVMSSDCLTMASLDAWYRFL